MVTLRFYEKSGCAGNARQKTLLRRAGHELEVRDLLTEAWTAARLRAVFGERAVGDCFNLSAPRVKRGEINPDALSTDQALKLMLAEPLLIRRPIIEVNGEYRVGFDSADIDAWIGLAERDRETGSLDGCPKADHAPDCGAVRGERA